MNNEIPTYDAEYSTNYCCLLSTNDINAETRCKVAEHRHSWHQRAYQCGLHAK